MSDDSPSPPLSRIERVMRGPAPVLLLLCCHFALAYSAVSQKSMTFDEGVHLAGGMSYWTLADYRMHPENGNWSQRLATLPLWLEGVRFVPQMDESWDTGLPWEISDHFLFHTGNDLTSMLAQGRAIIGIASVGLGLLVYCWSRRLFGAPGGLISLVLYAFSPTMLANGFVTTSDLLAAFFFTASVGVLWRLLNRVTLLDLVLACFALSGLMLSKFSGVLIAPMAAVMVVLRLSDLAPVELRIGHPREVHGAAPQLALFAVVALVEVLTVALVIWASYGFQYTAFAPELTNEATRFQVTWDSVNEGLPPYVRSSLQLARSYHLLPEPFLFGFAYTLFTGARHSFFDGVYYIRGTARFFPCCFAWKTPLATFVVLLMAAWACRVTRAKEVAEKSKARLSRPWWFPLTPLLVLWIIYWATAVTSSLNIGHRHILPTYPPLFILAGAAGLWFRPRLSSTGKNSTADNTTEDGHSISGRAPLTIVTARLIVLAALVAAVVTAVWSWPNYLAYFNVLSGGPDRAYRRLVDSSLDWGQDLKGLKQWLDAHSDESADPHHVYLSYFGMADPSYYGIDVQPLPSFRTRWHNDVPPPPFAAGLYAVSATMLQPIYGNYPGHWNAVYEQQYQTLRAAFEAAVQGGADMAACARLAPHLSPDELKLTLRNYEGLRFARLCSFLRAREPDAKIGYSILIYRLTDADVVQALAGPPCELLAKPENKP